MKSYLEKLNSEQFNAVTSKEKYIRVIAGAGSGKTRVLTSRIAYLVDEVGVYEKSILAFTFTNKAANEMKNRIIKQLNLNGFGSNISTFHSFCARFLREDINQIGYQRNFVIIDEEDQEDIIKEIRKKYDEDKVLKMNEIISYISDYKNKLVTPEMAMDIANSHKYDMLSHIYNDYEMYLKTNNYLDFDDLILKTIEVLKKNKNIQKKWQDRFSYILVDEYQDTDNQQYLLIKLLTNDDTNIFVVGDPDQTIYTWRGANMDIIMSFKKDFKGSVDYVLTKNYRSKASILNCANALILNNKYRVEKELEPVLESGKKPLLFKANNAEKEGEWIAKQISTYKQHYSFNYNDFAVLYRSNYYSAFIEHALINAGIPYEIYGGTKFYQRREIKDCMCYLRLIENYTDDLAFNRIINVPRRGIGNVALAIITDGADKAKISKFDYIRSNEEIQKKYKGLKDFINLIEKYHDKIKPENYPIFKDILNDIVHESGYYDSLDPIDDEERIENIHEFSDILANYQANNSEITLEEINESIALYSAADEIKDDDRVKLMTIHTAKGLEFKNVFVCGLANGIFPTSRALGATDKIKAIEEERRLCYVAFTRAMEHLFLTYNVGYSYVNADNNEQSIFVYEVNSYVQAASQPYYNSDFKSTINYSNTTHNEAPISHSKERKDKGYQIGDEVIHNLYGEGVIVNVNDSAVMILFKTAGQKMISKKFSGMHKKGEE